MSQALIKSSNDDTELIISDVFLSNDGVLQNFVVTIRKRNLHASAKVDGYLSEGFASLFADLDNLMTNFGGWTGPKSWASLEGELSLEATADSLGHTTLIATLKSGLYDLDWSLEIGLLLDASQLTQTAKDLGHLFESADA